MTRKIDIPSCATLPALLCLTLAFAGCSGADNNPGATATTSSNAFDPPEVTAGERLFLETRFAQFFKTYLDAGGTVNAPLPAGDPVVNLTMTTNGGLQGPFAGLSMNCRSCHLVDEHVGTPGGGMRTYSDFARRSPIPARMEDNHTTAPRNSPPLVNASLARSGGALFHFDGEFTTMTGLTAATFTGRNFGWRPGENAQAIAHVARIVREDDGSGALAQEFGGLALAVMLTGGGQPIPNEFRLPPAFRVNVASATDQEIFDGVVRLVAAYVDQLIFAQDTTGAFTLSPYDVFQTLNRLPRKPVPTDSPLDYSRRLRALLTARQQAGTLVFVSGNPNTADNRFQFHDQEFRFGTEELAGLMLFLAEPSTMPLTPTELMNGGIGNCTACHAAPNFTDFALHNTGTTQKEYDDLHGVGQFAQLDIPSLAERNVHPEMYLPATHTHPSYQEPFRKIPSLANPNQTDLGVWNVFANPDMPEPQNTIRTMLCNGLQVCPLSDDELLDRAIARVKTPGLRDLGHGAPYMHNGQFNSLKDIVQFYREASQQARAGTLRNGAPQLQGIALIAGDEVPLVAFLRSLNEDYQ